MNEMHLRPSVAVSRAHYRRLLGYPAGHQPGSRELELEWWAREWYRQNGRPWIYWRIADGLEIQGEELSFEGARIEHRPLASQFRSADCGSLALMVISAGKEAEEEAANLWRNEEPDRYYFLEIYASTVVEHLLTVGWTWLCNAERLRGLNVLPPVSPGHANWRVEAQAPLMRYLRAGSPDYLESRIDVLDSGMLRPKKSQLAIFGLTPRAQAHGPEDYVPCVRCGKTDCTFRRATHEESADTGWGDPAEFGEPAAAQLHPAPANAYAFHEKTLRRWATDRLNIVDRDDGGLLARFRYEGSTCSNLGWPLAFDFEFQLSSGDGDYFIERSACRPVAEDGGHRKMCGFLDEGEPFLAEIQREAPGAGMTLEQVLAWDPPLAPSGCLCNRQNRNHKWRIALQTVHYALKQAGVASRRAS